MPPPQWTCIPADCAAVYITVYITEGRQRTLTRSRCAISSVLRGFRSEPLRPHERHETTRAEVSRRGRAVLAGGDAHELLRLAGAAGDAERAAGSAEGRPVGKEG